MSNYFKYISTLLMLVALNATALEAVKSPEKMHIDGLADEASWQLAKWQPIDKLIFGKQPSAEDFSGRFKIM